MQPQGMRSKIAFFGLLVAVAHVGAKMEDHIDVTQRMFDWASSHGAEFHLEVGVNDIGIRGTFLTKDIPAGEAIVSMPPNLILSLGHGVDFTTTLLNYLREMKAPNSRFKPYIDSHPTIDNVICQCNFPPSYIPMLQHAQTEEETHAYLETLERIFSGIDDATSDLTINDVSSEPVTMEELVYACALTTTHPVTGDPRPISIMVPVFDLANYKRNCSTYLHYYDNPVGNAKFRMMAGDDMKKGEEMCYDYGDLTDDLALLHYGFLPPLEEPPLLLGVDSFAYNETAEQHEIIIFKALKTEIARLRAILDPLLVIDKKHEEGTLVHPPVIEGMEYLHAKLLELQQRRRYALKREIDRLENQLEARVGLPKK
eukprot:gene5771-6068_t